MAIELEKYKLPSAQTRLDLAKYQIRPEDTTEITTSGLQKTSKIFDMIFGGGKVGEAIGTQIAKGTFGEPIRKLVTGVEDAETAQFVDEGPTTKEIIGSALQAGALFTPVGRIAGAVARGAKALGLGSLASRLTGGVVASGGTGGVFDVSQALQGQEGFPAGLFVGSSLPLVGPLARATTKATGRAVQEISGTLTGTSQETIESAFNAARTGNQKELQSFTATLRNQLTPEQLRNNFRSSIDKVDRNRQLLFKTTLEEFGDMPVDTSKIRSAVNMFLNDFDISIKGNILDFSESKLRTAPAAQKKVQDMYNEITRFGSQATLKEVDTTRQALGILELAGEDPSANAANALIIAAKDKVRSAGQEIPEYKLLLEQFSDTSQFLQELKRDLASGDRATIDQTYRRIITSLKTNNEQRMALVQELDRLTDGSLVAQIAGQQLSELLPRGLFKQLGAAALGGAAFVSGLSEAIIPALLFASPRVSGEFTRALGLTVRQADILADAINDARRTLAKTYAVAPENLIKLITATGVTSE